MLPPWPWPAGEAWDPSVLAKVARDEARSLGSVAAACAAVWKGGGGLVVTVEGDIQSLRLAPTAMRRAIGESQHLTVRGVRAPDIDDLVTKAVVFESSDPSVVVVPGDPNEPGVIRTVGAGTGTRP